MGKGIAPLKTERVLGIPTRPSGSLGKGGLLEFDLAFWGVLPDGAHAECAGNIHARGADFAQGPRGRFSFGAEAVAVRFENGLEEGAAAQGGPVYEVAEPAKERLLKGKLAAVGEDLGDFFLCEAAPWLFPVAPGGAGLARLVEVGEKL
jgi:hypothetical protein